MTDAQEFAGNAGPVLREAILHIADGGERGVSTIGWKANWFAVILAHKRDGRLFIGLSKEEDTHGDRVKLTSFGREVADEIRGLLA